MPKRLPTPVLDRWEWQTQGACRGMDASVFFAPAGERGSRRRQREERARQICLRCPVREPCAAFAADLNERHGVWGGLSERERKPAER